MYWTRIQKTLLFLALPILVSVSGQAQSCAPGSGSTVTLHPGDDVQSLVNSNPCGSTFIFAPGVYPNVTVFPIDEVNHPIDGDSFLGQFSRTSSSPSILYGATAVNNFTQQGGYWVGHVTTSSAPASGSNYACDSMHPGCLLPEDLFFDATLYLRVTALANVAAGKWYLDYTTGSVYLTDNPTMHTIEVSTTHFAFYAGNVANVTIRNLIVDKYASPAGYGAISGIDPTGSTSPTYKWQIQNIEARHCHGAGVWLGNHMTVYKSFLHHNGEFGAAGTGNSVNFNNNEVSFNNLAGFLPEVGAGAKFTNILTLSATHNFVHDNLGPGLFDDTGTTNVTFSFNTLQNNRVAGILHEISYAADIHDNSISNDGIDSRGKGFWYGAGIMIANSSNVKVHNNTVVNSQNGIMDQARFRNDCATPCPLKNVSVYSNNITQDHTVRPGTIAAGLLMQKTYPSGTTVYTGAGNTFGIDPTTKTAAPNTYTLNPSGDMFFVWLQNGV
ncbi:MAG: right-handed parallel beta-helix repeat-containing protein, partial [Acidobacteria bacterium]|nr:right-handed parallel beta-helix repeat-containing protein [Acidobacteriota bacterium]